MIKIKVFMNSNNGVTYHRLYTPYVRLGETYPDIFTIDNWDFSNNEDEFKKLHEYDYFVYSRIIKKEFLMWIKANCPNTKIICDMDDYWVLDSTHPLFNSYKQSNMSQQLITNLEMADYITTTTDILKSKILPFNKNVMIYPNAVTFTPNKKRDTGRLRFGLIGGSSHTHDMELLEGVTNQLPPEILNKVQFVLCGFDKGSYSYKDGDKVKTVQVPFEVTCWGKWEKDLTNNYTTIDEAHKQFLLKYENIDYVSDQAYKRVWTKDIFTYHTSFDEIDVLLIPLQDNLFNSCKSPLKLAEAGNKGVAVICSDVEPYKQYLEDGINCIAVNNRKKTNGWVKAIKTLVNNPELVDKLANGLTETVNTYFNIDKITESRKEWFVRNV